MESRRLKNKGFRIDLSGLRFGRLSVIEYSHTSIGTCRHSNWVCLCDCGQTCVVGKGNLSSGHTQSCGCLAIERAVDANITHGYGRRGVKKSRLYRTWSSMIQRCRNNKSPVFASYGGRGIAVCPRWSSFELFRDDMEEEYRGHSRLFTEKNTTLERKDNNKGYFKENCCWTTREGQASNRRSNHLITCKGKTQTLSKWSREVGVSVSTLRNRIGSGWDIDKALETPIIHHVSYVN